MLCCFACCVQKTSVTGSNPVLRILVDCIYRNCAIKTTNYRLAYFALVKFLCVFIFLLTFFFLTLSPLRACYRTFCLLVKDFLNSLSAAELAWERMLSVVLMPGQFVWEDIFT